jgi:lipoate-protein ligase A
MDLITDTFTDPIDHLALDEALLLSAEEGDSSSAIRVWEFSRPVVVAGRSTKIDAEIDRGFCETNEIPIFRRCSGGASIVAGPGCLMYSVILSLDTHPDLRRIDAAHQHVMSRVLQAARLQVPEVVLQGICDLTWKNRKCSGNSLRIARQHLLYHGTILYDFELDFIARCLTFAPRQPEYRRERNHQDFVTNLNLDSNAFRSALCDVFQAESAIDANSYRARIRELRDQRYDCLSWHFRH